jgi:hypothetical protein
MPLAMFLPAAESRPKKDMAMFFPVKMSSMRNFLFF